MYRDGVCKERRVAFIAKRAIDSVIWEVAGALVAIAVEAFVCSVVKVLAHGPSAIGQVLPTVATVPPCAKVVQIPAASGRPAAYGCVGRPYYPDRLVASHVDRSRQIPVNPVVLPARYINGNGAHYRARGRFSTSHVDVAGVVAANGVIHVVAE